MRAGQRVRIILENGAELSAMLEEVSISMVGPSATMKHELRLVGYYRSDQLDGRSTPPLVNTGRMEFPLLPQGPPNIPVALTPKPAPAVKPAAKRRRSFVLSREQEAEAKQRAEAERVAKVQQAYVEAAKRKLQEAGIMLFYGSVSIDQAINHARQEMPNGLDSTTLNFALPRDAINRVIQNCPPSTARPDMLQADGRVLYRGVNLWPLRGVSAIAIEQQTPHIIEQMLVFWVARIGEEPVYREGAERHDWPAFVACDEIVKQHRRIANVRN